jgi:hypothetical protein
MTAQSFVVSHRWFTQQGEAIPMPAITPGMIHLFKTPFQRSKTS